MREKLPTRVASLAYLFAFIGFLFAVTEVSAATLRVDEQAGVDGEGCGTTANPCATIQKAVNLANSGDEVLVAAGTYLHDVAMDPCSPGDTAVVCIVEKELTIQGGYNPSDWTTSDPETNPTIIDGQDAFRGVLVKKTFPGAPGDASLAISGFTVTRGLATPVPGSSSPDGQGGGLKAVLVKTLHVADMTFQDCTAVGNDSGSGPGGTGAGGGVFVSTASSLPLVSAMFERVTFSSNGAQGGLSSGDDRGGFGLGGGMFIHRSVFKAKGLTFEGNNAQAGNSTGAGLTGFVRAESLGGGLAILRDATVTIQGLLASNNSATGGDASSSTGIGGTGAGGGLYVEGSRLDLVDADLRFNTVVGGNADTGGLSAGGGLMSFDAPTLLDRVALIGNQATGGDGPTKKGSAGGGGAYLERALDSSVSATIRNSIVADNRVVLGGGGGTVGGGGGGVFVLGNEVVFVHTTLARNELGSTPLTGQAVVVVPRSGAASHGTLRDTIIADHTSLANVAAVQAQSSDSSVTFERGLFAGNLQDTNAGAMNSGTFTGLATMESHNSAGFVSPGAPDFDYHILASSFARDATPESSEMFDFDRTFRGSPRDYGADEYCTAAQETVTLSNHEVSGAETVEACQIIEVGPAYVVASTGDLTLHAGARVVFSDGFQMESGAKLVVKVELP